MWNFLSKKGVPNDQQGEDSDTGEDEKSSSERTIDALEDLDAAVNRATTIAATKATSTQELRIEDLERLEREERKAAESTEGEPITGELAVG